MEKEKSFMVAIPEKTDDLKSIENLLNNLKENKNIEVVSMNFEEEVLLKLKLGENTYEVNIFPYEVNIPEMFRIQHEFKESDIQIIQNSAIGLGMEMEFGDDALTSYHDQLKIIHALLPELVAVLDGSSEKILSGMWVSLAAESNVPPAPRYLYTVQAVYDEEDCVWLHTHGLNRCGLTELEILNSTKDTYNIHYNVIETMASRMLELEEELEEYEPFYVAMVAEGIPLITTLVDWKEAVDQYEDDIQGSLRDRQDSHNENTSAIFCYLSPEDIENNEYSEIQEYDDLLGENPLYMLSNKETDRMRKLARERINYMIKMADDDEAQILVKIGLKIDEEYEDVDIEKEHIWFELLEVKSDSLVGELTQEPYYVNNLKPGDVREYSFDDITDWIIFTKDERITPDDVYLIEL